MIEAVSHRMRGPERPADEDRAFDACPTAFLVGTGAHSGATEGEMRTVRATVTDAVESNERVSVFATTPQNHTQILSRAPETVVAAIEDVIHKSS